MIKQTRCVERRFLFYLCFFQFLFVSFRHWLSRLQVLRLGPVLYVCILHNGALDWEYLQIYIMESNATGSDLDLALSPVAYHKKSRSEILTRFILVSSFAPTGCPITCSSPTWFLAETSYLNTETIPGQYLRVIFFTYSANRKSPHWTYNSLQCRFMHWNPHHLMVHLSIKIGWWELYLNSKGF